MAETIFVEIQAPQSGPEEIDLEAIVNEWEAQPKKPEFVAEGFSISAEARDLGNFVLDTAGRLIPSTVTETVDHYLQHYVPDTNVLAIVVGVPLLAYASLSDRISPKRYPSN